MKRIFWTLKCVQLQFRKGRTGLRHPTKISLMEKLNEQRREFSHGINIQNWSASEQSFSRLGMNYAAVGVPECYRKEIAEGLPAISGHHHTLTANLCQYHSSFWLQSGAIQLFQCYPALNYDLILSNGITACSAASHDPRLPRKQDLSKAGSDKHNRFAMFLLLSTNEYERSFACI
jgi:hypothetical protein